MLVIVDEPRTAAENVAINQACLEAVQEGKYESILRTYHFSKPGIILSRKQDKWDVRSTDVEVIRRPTGGAAVYVDENTIGYSYFTKAEKRDVRNQYDNLTSKVVDTLKSFGLSDVTCGYWDVRVDGSVVAGHAQQHRGNVAEIQGLLRLTSWDMDVLEKTLKLRKLVEHNGEKYLLVDDNFHTLEGTPVVAPLQYTVLRDEHQELAATPCLHTQGVRKDEFIGRLLSSFTSLPAQALPKELYRSRPKDFESNHLRKALGHCFVDLVNG